MLVVAASLLALTGVLPFELRPEPPEKLLVIAAAPDGEGVEVAAFAFVLQRGIDSATLLDTRASVTVPGTTAKSPRDALPFGGGAAVAKALSAQTGGTLRYVVLGPKEWGELIDRSGGIEVDLPQSVSSYQSGELVVLESGKRRLRGKEVAAVAAALDFMEDSDAAERSISAGLSAVTAAESDRLPALVADKRNRSDVSNRELEAFVSSR